MSISSITPRLVACLVLTALVAPSTDGRSVQASPTTQTPRPTPQPIPYKPVPLTDPVPDPKQAGTLWFAATGHTLRGSFLDYWQRNGGLAQFGYPLTEEFTEPTGKDNAPVMVQYFERSRLEHHPENAGTPYEVLLGTLGREFHPQDAPATPLPVPQIYPLPPDAPIYFNETGHNLQGAFRIYWEAHGGLAVNGYPLTEQFGEQSPTDGKLYTVQYFERARFELHPENGGSPYEVLLGQLGVQLSKKRGYPYGLYPAYGHAANYSWIAGKIGRPECTPLGRCCDRFYYEGPSKDTPGEPYFAPAGEGYSRAFARDLKGGGPLTANLLLVGHVAGEEEASVLVKCVPNTPIYIADYVYYNP